MESVLQVRLEGWTATPRLPFVLSGNALCLPVPTYSTLLGLIGCCVGRIVEGQEVRIGFRYVFDSVATDLETRRRLEFDGKRIKSHSKGSDPYRREFHVLPQLTLWLDRTDWKEYFDSPVGTPSLGRSQDILKIQSVRLVEVMPIEEATLSGCMLPFKPEWRIGGQLVQLAEAYRENDRVGSGRSATKTSIFIAIGNDNKENVRIPGLYRTVGDRPQDFYLHKFST